MTTFLLNTDDIRFPPPRLAGKDGLLAVGGDLRPDRLLEAYRAGIFPWFSEGDPVRWWSPDPRLVLFPEELKITRKLRRTISQDVFQITFNQAFATVIRSCANIKRKGEPGTWITDSMRTAYCRLHKAGWAHSVEAWQGDGLVGGAYGIAIGRCFFGESMFTRVSNASKAAFVHLVWRLKQAGFVMIDCQVTTAHLLSFGAREVPRDFFLKYLDMALTGCPGDGRHHLAESPDISRVDLSAAARHRTRSCSKSTASVLQHSRCAQGDSPEG